MRRSKAALILSSLILLLEVAGVSYVFGRWVPYALAKNTITTDHKMTLVENSDGTLHLSWEGADKADEYQLEVYLLQNGSDEEIQPLLYPEEETGRATEPAFWDRMTEQYYDLPDFLPKDVPVLLCIRSEKHYRVFGVDQVRVGDDPIYAVTSLEPPVVHDVRSFTDTEEQTMTVQWVSGEDDICKLYFCPADGEQQKLREQKESKTVLTFGENGDLPLPGRHETYVFMLDAMRETPNLIYYGAGSASFTLNRQDLLSVILKMDCEDTGNNSYLLHWNETKGQCYEVQISRNEGADWETLSVIDADEEIYSYQTPHLKPYQNYMLRVGAYEEEGGEPSAMPDHTSVKTAASPIYATVWPQIDLTIYADTDKKESIGTAGMATAYCVTEEKDGLFYVRGPGGTGYIDSNYCMIDLNDYIGDLCMYNITNSYSSIYMVHEYEIPEVTDTVISGYEHVQLPDGSFLVPLLYPAAQKLITAAEAVREDGYCLLIYDSFRPNKATRSIYDLTEAIINDPLPEETFTGKELDDLPELEAAPAAKTNEAGTAEGQEGETSEEAEEEGPVLTYLRLVTDGVYNLSNFLASRGSMHNLGVAMDLTLVRLSDGEELEMQTSIHDLSWYSILQRNNANAFLLDKYMKAAGFGGLTSEWWHFQDNEAKANLGLTNYMWQGVTPYGWRADDSGWRFRDINGHYYSSRTVSIDGVDYDFDEAGYATPHAG